MVAQLIADRLDKSVICAVSPRAGTELNRVTVKAEIITCLTLSVSFWGLATFSVGGQHVGMAAKMDAPQPGFYSESSVVFKFN